MTCGAFWFQKAQLAQSAPVNTRTRAFVGKHHISAITGIRFSLKKMMLRRLGATALKLSVVSMGGSGFGSVYGQYSKEAATLGVRRALDVGINYIDTAYWYGQGQSELFLGKALQGVRRENFVIATKVGRYEQDHHKMFDFSAEAVTKSATESLKRLQLDHVDILQIHDVEFVPSIDLILHQTLPALNQLKKKGLCRYIGITGYSLSFLVKLIEKSTIPIDCVLSYCRLTLNDTSLRDYFEFFNSRGVGIINASPVGMGLLTLNGPQVQLKPVCRIFTLCNICVHLYIIVMAPCKQ